MLLALGDFRRNLLDAMELRGFRGFGGRGRFGAGNGPKPWSESSGPSDFQRSRGLKSTGTGVAAGAVRTAVIAGSVDNRAVAPGRAEYSLDLTAMPGMS
jgi:hypothetical protein